MTTTSAPARPAERQRVAGLDVARAIAFAGMLLAHFAASGQPGDPGWLRNLDEVADGRAAPLFCVLLGVGCGMYVRRRPARGLATRGAALLALGLAVWPLVDRVYLILPQYGVLMVVAALLVRLPDRSLLPAAALMWIVPSAIVGFVDGHGLRTAEQPEAYAELADVPSLLWQIVWSGGYPAIGWLGFVLAGIWVSRLDLRARRVQVRLLVLGLVAAAAQPVGALVLDGLGGVDGQSAVARGAATFFDGSAHSNQTAWYVAACGTAIAVIALCALVVRSDSPPLASLGRCALTAYLLHLTIGAHLVWPWRDEGVRTLSAQVLVAVATFALLWVLAHVWLRFSSRGPLEWVLRKIAP